MSDPNQPGVEEEAVAFDAEVEPVALSEEEEAELLEAEADADAGHVVPHSEVRKWMLAVGTPDEFPMPKSWLK
jgi:predicted transcriptional regulator